LCFSSISRCSSSCSGNQACSWKYFSRDIWLPRLALIWPKWPGPLDASGAAAVSFFVSSPPLQKQDRMAQTATPPARQAFKFHFPSLSGCPAAGCPAFNMADHGHRRSQFQFWTSSPKETGDWASRPRRRRLHLRPGVHGRQVGAPVLSGCGMSSRCLRWTLVSWWPLRPWQLKAYLDHDFREGRCDVAGLIPSEVMMSDLMVGT
jgi:hypothetical protein